MESLDIAAVDPEDISTLRSIETACQLSPWTERAYRDELMRPDAVLLKALTEEKLVAGFIVGRVPEVQSGPQTAEAEIYNLGTLPAFQGRGIASRLLQRFTLICEERRVQKVWLEVRVSNARAIEFYNARGFSKVGVRTAFYTTPIENAEIMCLEVKTGLVQQTSEGA